jgi:hypothetical protein
MRLKNYILLVFALAIVVSCDNSEPVDFVLEQNTIKIEAVGGVEKIKLNAADRWIASTDNPWITVSPANGIGTTMCEFHIDSALTAEPRRGVVRIQNLSTNEEQEVVVEQLGFPYCITVANAEVSVDNYDRLENRYFDVVIKSNIDFDVNIPEGANWLSNEEY